MQDANKTDTPLSIENRRWKSKEIECNEFTPGAVTALSGDSCPGPGRICAKDTGLCATVIGDECCAPAGDEYWWCDLPPMCNADTPKSIEYPSGLTTHTKGVFCPTTGEYTTCYEALAHINIPQPGFFCAHWYFWPQHSRRTCTVTLPNPDYHGLRFAKASCINVGDDCWGVLDTNCDGYEYTKLCTEIGAHSDLVVHTSDCVHEKTFRHAGSYFALCAESEFGSERVSPSYTFTDPGVFCADESGLCRYTAVGERAGAWGAYCHDEHLRVAPTLTYTTTTPPGGPA